MHTNIIKPDAITVELTLSSSEASALITLLTEGYDEQDLGHDWNPLVMILSSFTDRCVIRPVGSEFPFKKVPTDPGQAVTPSPKRLDHHLSGN